MPPHKMKVANTKLEADTALPRPVVNHPVDGYMFLVGDVAKAVSPYYTYPLTIITWSLIDLYSLFDQ